jgi:hypothetical protein
MEPEGSIPHSQELSTCPYPEPDQSSPHHPIQPLQGPSVISKWYRRDHESNASYKQNASGSVQSDRAASTVLLRGARSMACIGWGSICPRKRPLIAGRPLRQGSAGRRHFSAPAGTNLKTELLNRLSPSREKQPMPAPLSPSTATRFPESLGGSVIDVRNMRQVPMAGPHTA